MPADPTIPRPAATLGIVGCGLLGGSIAAAARRAWPDQHIIAVDRADALEDIERVIGVNRTATALDAVIDADLIVVATPIEAIAETLDALARTKTTAIITDVASVKREVMHAARLAGLPDFVGGHPMAGLEKRGAAHARPDLFDGRSWAIVPGPTADAAVEVVETLVVALGARPVRITADEHDRVVACLSHLPQAVGVALMNAVGERCQAAGLQLAGPALWDMTRLASSPVAVWQDIFTANADQVRGAIDAFVAELTRVRDALDDESVGEAFADAATWRRRLEEGPES